MKTETEFSKQEKVGPVRADIQILRYKFLTSRTEE